MEQQIRIYMNTSYPSFIDDCGELDCTGLAESCADYLGHDEWLNDASHFVWDYPVDLAERHSL